MTMTHTANAEPRLPHDYATPPAAPVREYRMTPEEAARYPAVRPTRADFSDAAEAGWTPDRFAATYGRDAKHAEVLRKAFRSVLDARDMRRRRGEDEDERPPAERSGPAVTTSEWIVRIKAVLREHPDWSRRQVADGLGTTTGVINNAMVRTGSNLTELRARVQRELAEATDNAAEIVDTGVQTVDKNAEVNSMPVPVGNEWLTQVEALILKHPHWRVCDYAKSLGITQKALEQRLHHRGLRLKELKIELIHGCIAPTTAPTTPAPEPPPTEPAAPVEGTDTAADPVFERHTHDVCQCGDYRHQHRDHTGKCYVCQTSRAPYSNCQEFRLSRRYVPGEPIPVICSGCGATAPNSTETLYHNPGCPLIGPDLAEAPPTPVDIPSVASGGESQTCPICHRAVADCNHHGDCERSGRHGADDPAPEAPPTSAEATLTPLSPDAASTATGVNCTECCGPMIRRGTRYRCPECDVPEVGESRPAQTPLWVEAVSCAICNRPASVCDCAGDCERSVRYKAPPPLPRPPLANLCASCVKADVCRYLEVQPVLAAQVNQDVDLGGPRYGLVVEDCQSYRGEGAA